MHRSTPSIRFSSMASSWMASNCIVCSASGFRGAERRMHRTARRAGGARRGAPVTQTDTRHSSTRHDRSSSIQANTIKPAARPVSSGLTPSPNLPKSGAVEQAIAAAACTFPYVAPPLSPAPHACSGRTSVRRLRDTLPARVRGRSSLATHHDNFCRVDRSVHALWLLSTWTWEFSVTYSPAKSSGFQLMRSSCSKATSDCSTSWQLSQTICMHATESGVKMGCQVCLQA